MDQSETRDQYAVLLSQKILFEQRAGVGQLGSIACGSITGNEGQTRNIIFENPKMGGATEVSRTGRGSAATSRSHRVWPEGPDLHKPRGQGPDLHKPVTQEVSGSRAQRSVAPDRRTFHE